MNIRPIKCDSQNSTAALYIQLYTIYARLKQMSDVYVLICVRDRLTPRLLKLDSYIADVVEWSRAQGMMPNG